MLSLQVVAAGVCGSDRDRLASGQHIDSLGHELVAWEPRQERFVAIRPLAPCGRCGPCTRGATEHCADDAGLGRRPDRVAGFGGRVTVRPDQVYPLPDTLPVPTALLADPLACLWHALHGIPLAGAQVLVIGDGALAALACLMARERGAEHVEVAVKCEERRSRMQPFADVVVTTGQSSPRGYDLVLEAAGGPGTDAILSAVAAVAPLGNVVCLGVYPPHVTAAIPVRLLLEKGSTIRGSKAYRLNRDRDDFARALAFLADHPSLFAPVISAVRPWLRGPDDVRLATGLKVVFTKNIHGMRRSGEVAFHV